MAAAAAEAAATRAAPAAPPPPLPPSTGVRVAATAAGVATKLVLYPLDSLKVRVQTVRVARAAASAAGGAAAAAGVGGSAAPAAGGAASVAAAATPAASALRVAVRGVAQGGGGAVGVARRLYGGLPAAVVGVLPHAWVYMPVYVGVGEALKVRIENGGRGTGEEEVTWQTCWGWSERMRRRRLGELRGGGAAWAAGGGTLGGDSALWMVADARSEVCP